MDSNFTKALTEALPTLWSGVSQPFPGNWPAFIRCASWSLVVEPEEHCPMYWTTDVVYRLDLDGVDMRDDYPGFGRRLEYEEAMRAGREEEEKEEAAASQASPANPPPPTNPSPPSTRPSTPPRPHNPSPSRLTRRSSRSRSPRSRSGSPIGRASPSPSTKSRREEREQAKEREIAAEEQRHREMEELIEKTMKEAREEMGIVVKDEDGSEEGEVRE